MNKSPRPRGAGRSGREGPLFLVVVGGWQGEEEESACEEGPRGALKGQSTGPHLSSPKERLEFPSLCTTSRRVLGTTDLLPPSATPPPARAWSCRVSEGGPRAEDSEGMALPLISCVVSGKSHPFSEPQFSPWQNGEESTSLR